MEIIHRVNISIPRWATIIFQNIIPQDCCITFAESKTDKWVKVNAPMTGCLNLLDFRDCNSNHLYTATSQVLFTAASFKLFSIQFNFYYNHCTLRLTKKWLQFHLILILFKLTKAVKWGNVSYHLVTSSD